MIKHSANPWILLLTYTDKCLLYWRQTFLFCDWKYFVVLTCCQMVSYPPLNTQSPGWYHSGCSALKHSWKTEHLSVTAAKPALLRTGCVGQSVHNHHHGYLMITGYELTIQESQNQGRMLANNYRLGHFSTQVQRSLCKRTFGDIVS